MARQSPGNPACRPLTAVGAAPGAFAIMIDEPEYGAAAKGLHWLTALLLTVQFALGWIMPNIGRGAQPESLMNLHLSIGVVILAAALGRVAWRLFHGPPPPESSLPAWPDRMARR